MLRNRRVVAHRDQLDQLFHLGRELLKKGKQEELLSHLSRYICIRVSGFLEESVRTLLIEYARQHANPNVLKVVEWRLRRFSNPKWSQLKLLLTEFDLAPFKSLSEGAARELSDSVDGIVQNRHQIAHGQSAGISFSVVADYYKRILRVVECLEDSLLGA